MTINSVNTSILDLKFNLIITCLLRACEIFKYAA